MWNIIIRAIPSILIGVGLSDIATDWFKKRDPGEKPNVKSLIMSQWVSWIVSAGIVVLILKYTNLLKKRM